MMEVLRVGEDEAYRSGVKQRLEENRGKEKEKTEVIKGGKGRKKVK